MPKEVFNSEFKAAKMKEEYQSKILEDAGIIKPINTDKKEQKKYTKISNIGKKIKKCWF